MNILREFLADYPGMSTVPCTVDGVCLRGQFAFNANAPGKDHIVDEYQLEILVPAAFPREIPTVKETDGKIPHSGDFHVNADGTLCLGSPLRLLRKANIAPTLAGFAANCLVPYLYAVSYKLTHGGHLVFGELDHGDPGLMDDYSLLLGLREKKQLRDAIQLLAVTTEAADACPCPCACGKKLAQCSFREKLNEFRQLATPRWLKEHTALVLNQFMTTGTVDQGGG